MNRTKISNTSEMRVIELPAQFFRESKVVDNYVKTSLGETTSTGSSEKRSMEEPDEYDIAYVGNEIDPWSKSYVGVIFNYFSVGLMLGGSHSILYPVLVVREGVTSSLLSASNSLITIFWSYKIFFGFLSDCFPIFGYKRKPYIAMGWILCGIFLCTLASEGSEIDATRLVTFLTLANLGYVMADVSADGFMVWIAHREPLHKRGRMQTLIYSTNVIGQIVINVVILIGFSGPAMNCPGFERDINIPCTTNKHVTSRNDLYLKSPENWCYEKCDNAVFDFDLTVPQFSLFIVSVIFLSLPSYLVLNEERCSHKGLKAFLSSFSNQIKRRAIWQVMLYSMISHITFGVVNAAKVPANFVWLNLQTTQNQIMVLMEKLIMFIGLRIVRKYALHVSWRKLLWIGSGLVTFFNLLYFIIVFDFWRNVWFYIFTDVTEKFIYSVNFITSLFCMVEVAEPGYEALTYALITSASNSVSPLSSVISYQLLSFFPDLNTQQSIAMDTNEVRTQFATLHTITIIINLSSLLVLPMLPRQKKETRDLCLQGETSSFWGRFALGSMFTFLAYSTLVTFITVARHDVYGCFKIFGGGGCSADESSAPAYILVSIALFFCYGVNFYHSFWPILQGRSKFSFSMFF